MGFIFAPGRKAEAQERLAAIMGEEKRALAASLPFAMEPVVYDFRINGDGTSADLLSGDAALMPKGYYLLLAPQLLRRDPKELPAATRAELDRFASACRTRSELRGVVQELFDALLPRLREDKAGAQTLDELLVENGFDRETHEQIRADLRAARIGLAQNRLPANTVIEDARPEDVTVIGALEEAKRKRLAELGSEAIRRGEAAVVTLAAGAASRWTQGAGVVKSLHPFCKLGGRHRTFLEVHLAKSRRISRLGGAPVPHVFTTGYLTHGPLTACLAQAKNYGYEGSVHLSKGASVGLRLIPTARDLRFAWEEMPQQVLDERQQKVRDSLRGALLRWAEGAGEGSDYRDNLPPQCLHPVGHFYELPNLLRNGTLAALLRKHPKLRAILLHNIDTTGANLDPVILGQHLESGATLSFEMITRRLDDRGGGLARVDGRPRLVEGLAMPREELEFGLSYYNTMTTWVEVDGFPPRAGFDARGRARRRRRKDHGGHPRAGGEGADVHHAERREETLGARAGGCVSRGAVRETMERSDGVAGDRMPVSRGIAPARPATQGSGAARRVVARWFGEVCGGVVRVVGSTRAFPSPCYRSIFSGFTSVPSLHWPMADRAWCRCRRRHWRESIEHAPVAEPVEGIGGEEIGERREVTGVEFGGAVVVALDGDEGAVLDVGGARPDPAGADVADELVGVTDDNEEAGLGGDFRIVVERDEGEFVAEALSGLDDHDGFGDGKHVVFRTRGEGRGTDAAGGMADDGDAIQIGREVSGLGEEFERGADGFDGVGVVLGGEREKVLLVAGVDHDSACANDVIDPPPVREWTHGAVAVEEDDQGSFLVCASSGS
jgi:hypothetical protein